MWGPLVAFITMGHGSRVAVIFSTAASFDVQSSCRVVCVALVHMTCCVACQSATNRCAFQAMSTHRMLCACR